MAAIRKRTWQHNGQRRSAFEFSLYHDGKRIRRLFATRAEAQFALDTYRDELKKPKAAAVLEFGIAIDRVVGLKARAASSTRQDYARVATALKAEFGADTPVTSISAARIAEWEAKRLAITRKIGKGADTIEKPLSLASLNRPRALLRHVLRQAHEWGALSTVPKIRTPKETGRLRWLRPEEAVRLLTACRKSPNKVLADLVEFALFTGVRKSEALNLTWDRVDRAVGTVLLVETKNGEPRTVRLNQRADAVLARRWTPGVKGLVFGVRNWSHCRTAWETALQVARIDDFRFHDLRHTFASWMVQRGRPLKEVQEALGHKTLDMTLRYAHLAPENLRQAVAVLDDVLPPDGNKVGTRDSSPQHLASASVSLL